MVSLIIMCLVEMYLLFSLVVSCCVVVIVVNDLWDSCGCVLVLVVCGKWLSRCWVLVWMVVGLILIVFSSGVVILLFWVSSVISR